MPIAFIYYTMSGGFTLGDTSSYSFSSDTEMSAITKELRCSSFGSGYKFSNQVKDYLFMEGG